MKDSSGSQPLLICNVNKTKSDQICSNFENNQMVEHEYIKVKEFKI